MTTQLFRRLGLIQGMFALVACAAFGEPSQAIDTARGDKMIAEYFRVETEKLRDASLSKIDSLEAWAAKKDQFRDELLEMLGLDPLPERTDLKPVVTGKIDHEEFTVENIQFQSWPGLYVTGNLYLPKNIDQPLPAILYVCGQCVCLDLIGSY